MSMRSKSLIFICGLLWLSVVENQLALFSMRRVTGTSLGLRPGSAFALAPRASSLALRRCRVFGLGDQGREHGRFKRRSRVGLFTSDALAVQVLDGLPFPPQLAVTGADVEDSVAEARQVTLGKRKLALGVVAMEQVEAVNAAGDA
ncbi:hypothetical protein; putative exported protein [Marinobacter nauticus ATCC 49840]|nr:hypothetical protein; putative exported protein [Marinobacter nauticus ATCC 49840]